MNIIKNEATVDILPMLKFEMIKSLVMAVVYSSYGYGLLISDMLSGMVRTLEIVCVHMHVQKTLH